MTRKYKHRSYWTKKKCIQEALKYDTKTELFKKSSSVYRIASQNGWLDEICSHMSGGNRSIGYWTKEKCREEALKYKTKSEFKKHSRGAHFSAYSSEWYDEICSHMVDARFKKAA